MVENGRWAEEGINFGRVDLRKALVVWEVIERERKDWRRGDMSCRREVWEVAILF